MSRRPHNGRRRDDPPSPRLIHVPQELDRFLQDIRGAPKIDLKHRARLIVNVVFNFRHKSVARIVEHDVDAPKLLFDGSKCFDDICFLGHVHLEEKELVRGILLREMGKHFGLSKCGDRDMALSEDVFRHREAESSGGASD